MRTTFEPTQHQWSDWRLITVPRAPERTERSGGHLRRGAPARPWGAALLLPCLLLYGLLGTGWGLFALLVLAPDLAALGFLAGPRWGAHAYNTTHRALTPALLVGIGVVVGVSLAASLGLIWLTHIAIDRLLGYGLFVTRPAASRLADDRDNYTRSRSVTKV